MADQLSNSVAFGRKLSKRIYYGKLASLSAPKSSAMERSSETCYLPQSPMVYAEISEPSIVDNPDIPSYQPYVHGMCDPPALIPLHMLAIEMEVECYLDTAFVTVSGIWRVHCVIANKSCDCRIAIPMGEQGSVLAVDVSTTRNSFYTQLITTGDTNDVANMEKSKDGCLLKRRIYTLKVSQVEGGSNLHVKARWSQKLVYEDGQFCLRVPFSFPAYVIPVSDNITKKEKILLKLNAGVGTQVLCKATSHPLTELRRGAGELVVSYESDVKSWSISDFLFSYSVCSTDISGGLLLQSPSIHDVDQREMFCFYLFPGTDNHRKVFRRVIVFIVDISASMRGGPIESAKTALLEAISNLNPIDAFNIIAFNENTTLLSPSMVPATNETIANATEWISRNFIPNGGTNMVLPLNQAIEMAAKAVDSVPLIFLITDGTVENDKDICKDMKNHLAECGLPCPRICTFGIGSYCNHYFLEMLAQIGKGCHDAAYDNDSITFRLQRLFDNASSLILTNIKIDALEHLDKLELYPFHIPDLSTGCPVIISGRYCGNFPDSVKASGIMPDLTTFVIDVKAHKAKDIPLDRVLARRHIDTLTCHAWLSGSKQFEEKVTKMSLQTGFPSEYTSVVFVQTDKGKQSSGTDLVQELIAENNVPQMMGLNGRKCIFLRNMGIGFGNLIATAENLPPESAEPKLHEARALAMKAARLMDRCCCMCFIQICSQLNDRFAVAFTQLCTALACFECLNLCSDICDSCDQCC